MSTLARLLQLLAELTTQRRFRVAMLIATTGVAAVVLSYFTAPTQARIEIQTYLLLEGGIVLLVAAIAEFILLEHASRAMVDETRHMLANIRRDYSIVNRSLGQGLVDILQPRRGRHSTETESALYNVLVNSRGVVRVSGISLREFLDGRSVLSKMVLDWITDDVTALT